MEMNQEHRKLLRWISTFIHFNQVVVIGCTLLKSPLIVALTVLVSGDALFLLSIGRRFGFTGDAWKNEEWIRRWVQCLMVIGVPSIVLLELRKVMNPSICMVLLLLVSLIQWGLYRKISET